MAELTIHAQRFNDLAYIEARLLPLPEAHKGSLKTALCYLYMDDGPINIPRDRQKMAERYLEPAELIVIRWLATRTNGSERKHYGARALLAARLSRYRCETCGFSDVRALNLDHIEGRIDGASFACLCANCHSIKSRTHDWTGNGRKLLPKKLADDDNSKP